MAYINRFNLEKYCNPFANDYTREMRRKLFDRLWNSSQKEWIYIRESNGIIYEWEMKNINLSLFRM